MQTTKEWAVVRDFFDKFPLGEYHDLEDGDLFLAYLWLRGYKIVKNGLEDVDDIADTDRGMSLENH